MGPRIVGLAVAVLVAASARLSAECMVLTRPPLVVSGALCGTFIDGSGATVNSGEALLETPDGDVVATAISDDDGNFQFGHVPPGDYRINLEGFQAQTRTVRLLKASGSVCSKRVQVRLSIYECPSEMFGTGGLRLRVDADTPVKLLIDGDEEEGDLPAPTVSSSSTPGSTRSSSVPTAT